MDFNKITYSNKKVIAYYEKYGALQKPEQNILSILKSYLFDKKMLDIGIGAGRTTTYFAPLVKEYIGIDFSKGMIDVCKKKFGLKYSNLVFQEVDARQLGIYQENEFDFILFSFNGIDYVSANERFLVLNEINRILKSGGFFCFSSHNIQSLKNSNKFPLGINFIALIKQIIVWRKVKKMNAEQLKLVETNDFITINDGAHNFGLEANYFRPIAQQKILNQIGFKNIRFFSLETGNEINIDNISKAEDRWLYYLCQKS